MSIEIRLWVVAGTARPRARMSAMVGKPKLASGARDVAVGGRVTPLPPAQIPACAANAPGSCRRSDVIGLRGLVGPYISDPWARRCGDMPIPALCPGHA